MAGGAGFRFYCRLCCRMNDFFLKVLLLVAAEAQVTAIGHQKLVALGGVGVVALDALAGLQGWMYLGFVQPDFIFLVTIIADLIAFFFKQ